jgi:hypothetical protein
VAERLAKELRAEGSVHPLVRAKVTTSPAELAVAIRGVSRSAGDMAEELAWQRIESTGSRSGSVFMPDELWTDTGMTAQELAVHEEGQSL